MNLTFPMTEPREVQSPLSLYQCDVVQTSAFDRPFVEVAEDDPAKYELEIGAELEPQPDSKLPNDEETVDKILASEMSQLSVQDREKLYHEVHGVADVQAEDPHFVDGCLAKMADRLSKIRKKPAYDKAVYVDAPYVEDPSFRLMFLRAEAFDPYASAVRMVRHFEEKYKLFGLEKLCKDIVLSDLNEHDQGIIRSGAMQLLPARDRGGRAVICMTTMLREGYDLASAVRPFWYLNMVLLQDDETQKSGIVFVVHNAGSLRSIENVNSIRYGMGVRQGIPHRIMCVHYCFDDQALRPFLSGMRMLAGKRIRSRFRPHFGTASDFDLTLQTYGIPTQYMPLIGGTESDPLRHHKEWLEALEYKERLGEDRIIVPRRFDVLFGKWKAAVEHTGNLRATHIVDMHRPKYERANKYEKTEIAERIVDLIREAHGRFLKRDQGGWVEVDDGEAREKISKIFRRLRGSSKNTTSTERAIVTGPSSADSKELSVRHRADPTEEVYSQDVLGKRARFLGTDC